MYMVEITEDKFDKAYEHVEKAIKAMGKVMQCFEEWQEESEMGERRGTYGNREGQNVRRQSGGSYGNRYGMRGYGERMGYRDDDEDWEDYEMGERRGVRGSGRGRR